MAGVPINVTGMAKGVGMLQPNMATMLAFIATDARVSRAMLQRMVGEVADASFNRVTVDGDTSTNDSFVLIATGASAAPEVVAPREAGYVALKDAVTQVAVELAQSIARDGEGATKFITINVNGAKSDGRGRARGEVGRAFAAGEDRIFCVGPQPWPADHGDRQCRHRRS